MLCECYYREKTTRFIERGSLLCSLAVLQTPKVVDVCETGHLNAHYNLLTVWPPQGECTFMASSNSICSTAIVYLICLMQSNRAKHLLTTTRKTEGLHIYVLLWWWTEARSTGSVTRRGSYNMKATLLWPPKNCVFCFVVLCFPPLAMLLFAQKHRFAQNQNTNRNQSGGVWQTTAKDWFLGHTIELSFLQFWLQFN